MKVNSSQPGNLTMEIAKQTVVSLRYIMKNSEGHEIENTIAGPAIHYVHGAGKILPQLEILLEGLKVGDKKSLTIDLPDTFHFDIAIDQVRMATPEEIEAGTPLVRNDCGPGCSC